MILVERWERSSYELPGGLYALLESSDDIGGSWKALIEALSIHSR